MTAWRWPVADEVAYNAPRPPGWPTTLEGFYVLVKSDIWQTNWWKLTEVYLLDCYYHLQEDVPGKLLDQSIDWADANAKWEMALEILTRAQVVRTVDGYPTRAVKVTRPGAEQHAQAARKPGPVRKDME